MDLANSEPPFKGLKTVESKGTSLQNSSDRWVGSANNHFKEADEERQHRSKLNLAVSINKVNSLQQAWPKTAVFEVRKRKEYRMNAGSVPPLSANKFLFHIINFFFQNQLLQKILLLITKGLKMNSLNQLQFLLRVELFQIDHTTLGKLFSLTLIYLALYLLKRKKDNNLLYKRKNTHEQNSLQHSRDYRFSSISNMIKQTNFQISDYPIMGTIVS